MMQTSDGKQPTKSKVRVSHGIISVETDPLTQDNLGARLTLDGQVEFPLAIGLLGVFARREIGAADGDACLTVLLDLGQILLQATR